MAWPTVRIVSAREAGREAASRSYAELRRAAMNSLAASGGAASEAWREAARSAWGRQERLLAMVVSDPESGVLYALPSASPFYRLTEQGSRRITFDYPDLSVVSHSGTVTGGLTLEALYVTLSRNDVYYPMRDAAMALSALLVAFAAWLIAASAPRPASKRVSERYSEAGDASPKGSRGAASEEAPSAPSGEASGITLSTLDTPLAEEEPLFADTETAALPEAIQSPPDAEPARATMVRPADLPAGALDGPHGLFDPDSGLGWESYLRERLGSELRRAASFEQDLSLLIASIDSSRRGDESFNLFAITTRDFFTFKDMAFLFGSNGVAIILPNVDVDHAVRMCEELYKKLNFLFQARDRSVALPDLHMGLSSRSGRLVESDRLVGEAMASLNKSREDAGGHIVAFRPDPEKFRAFLAGQ